ncbi:MAG: potassium/proton antiporter [Bacteroidales bacterium]|nr:potassium/proton antiporter [Bacteroidales bacterium]
MIIESLAVFAVVIVLCVLLNNVSSRLGIPVLLAFLLLGMLYGNISPDMGLEYDTAGSICSVALIFIMFYGGFGTSWRTARKVAVEASLLATAGVFLTALVTGLFCRFVLGWGWIEALLMGSVVSSTDAASVFSILRSRRLGLKNNIAPLLEVESGSNDPMSYMLTMVMLSLLGPGMSGGAVLWMLVKQIVIGAGLGLAIAKGTVYVMRRFKFATSGFDSLFILAVAIFSYAIPNSIGGNGYLSAYIVGIMLGNSEFPGKKSLVGFFDGLTNLMMVIIFFDLGLLARPSVLLESAIPAVAIFFCLLLIARPLSVFAVLMPFRKYTPRQNGFISFVGLRGAASIAFAIMAMGEEVFLEHDIVNIVFGIVLISIAAQGSLIPMMARRFGVVDSGSDVMKTFNDFAEEADVQFIEVEIDESNTWADHQVLELNIQKGILMCMIYRGEEHFIPDGHTVIRAGDRVVLASKAFRSGNGLMIVEETIQPGSPWAGIELKNYPIKNRQVVLIKRGEKRIIPHGNTVIREDDVLYINRG